MSERRNQLRNKIRFLTAVSIISIVFATVAVASCILIIVYGFININTAMPSEKEIENNIIVPESETQTENTSPANEETNADIEFSDDFENIDESTTLDVLLADAQNSGNISAEKLLYDIKNSLAQGDSTTAVFRRLFPDDVVVNIGKGYTFFPINKDLKLNEKPDEIDLDDVQIVRGIDVSRYQGEIDWETVSSQDIDYAIIRLGIRGYSEGGLILDDSFEYNMENARKNNIPIGVYFFTQATSDEEAIEEAEYVIENLKNYKIEWPVYLDTEYVDGTGRADNISVEDRTQYCVTFLERIKKAGYNVGIYGNLKTFITMVDMSRLQDFDIWLAAYTYPIYFPYHYDMLQHTEKGNVDGINTTVDLNVSWKKY